MSFICLYHFFDYLPPILSLNRQFCQRSSVACYFTWQIFTQISVVPVPSFPLLLSIYLSIYLQVGLNRQFVSGHHQGGRYVLFRPRVLCLLTSPPSWVSSGQSTVGYKRRTFLFFSCFFSS